MVVTGDEFEEVVLPTSVGGLGAAPPGGKSVKEAKVEKKKATITGIDDGNPYYKAELDKGII